MNFFLRYILPILVLIFLGVNYAVEEPVHQSLADEIEHTKKTVHSEKLQELFYSVQEDSNYLMDDHFNFITLFFDYYRDTLSYPNDLIEDIKVHYVKLSYSEVDSIRDLALFTKGYLEYKLLNYTDCINDWGAIDNQDIKYLNYHYGLIYRFHNDDYAKTYFEREFNEGGAKELAAENLVALFERLEDTLKYDSLLSSTDNQFLGLRVRREHYIKNYDWLNYQKVVFKRFERSFNSTAFVGALLIMIIWFFYLRKIDFTSYRKPIHRYFIVFFFGMVFAYGTSILTDINKYIIGFNWNKELLNDFMYCIIGIGVVEELVKFLPLLGVLLFTKWLKEPIDYLIFASVSALGFSFLENVLYFGNSGIHIIQGRALTATVSHMFDSSIVAYGLVIGVFTKKNVWISFIAFFMIAAVTHGFYDFWIIRFPGNHFLQLITLVFLLLSMFVWTGMINNCLNNSDSFSSSNNYNQQRIFLLLLSGLSLVFVYEFVALSFTLGTDFANAHLSNNLLSGLFLLLFVAFSLSRFDIVKNYWAPIRLWDWQTIMNIPSMRPVFFNLKNIIGQRVLLESFRDISPLKNHLPIEGTIINRELISWEKDWYLVKLDNPLNIGWKMQEYVLIQVKDRRELIFSRETQLVSLRLVNDPDLLEKKIKTTLDFLFIDFAKITKINPLK